MKKILIATALVFIIITAAAGTSPAGTPKTVTTKKTPYHHEVFEIPLLVKISQSSAMMKTPAGISDKQAKITLEASVLYTPIETLLNEFDGEKLQKRGLELKSSEEFLWNNSRALLMKVFQPLGEGKVKGQWIFVVDRKDHTWMLNGTYNAENQQRSEKILSILQTAWWDPNEMLAADRTLKDGLDTSGTPFQLAKASSGALIYTKDGKLPTNSRDKAVFVISKIGNSHIPIGKRAEFAKANCADAASGSNLEIISEKNMNNGTLSEIVAKADDEKDKAIIYQTMIFSAADYNVMVGITHTTDETNVGYFKKLAESAILKFAR